MLSMFERHWFSPVRAEGDVTFRCCETKLASLMRGTPQHADLRSVEGPIMRSSLARGGRAVWSGEF